MAEISKKKKKKKKKRMIGHLNKLIDQASGNSCGTQKISYEF